MPSYIVFRLLSIAPPIKHFISGHNDVSYIILLNVLLTLIFFNTLKSPIKLIYITCSWCLPIKQHFTGFF